MRVVKEKEEGCPQVTRETLGLQAPIVYAKAQEIARSISCTTDVASNDEATTRVASEWDLAPTHHP